MDALGHGRQRTQQGERVWKIAVIHHVVLRQENPIETRLFSYLCSTDGLPHPPAYVFPLGGVLNPEQYPELHAWLPLVILLTGNLTNTGIYTNIKTATYVYFNYIVMKSNHKAVKWLKSTLYAPEILSLTSQ